MNRSSFLLLTGLLFTLSLQSPAFSDIFNIPGDADNLAAVLRVAEAGDEIIIGDGGYTGLENCNLDIEVPLTIRSENGPDNCVFFDNGDDRIRNCFEVSADLTVAGITFDGFDVGVDFDTDWVRIDDCVFIDCVENGLRIQSDDFELTNSRIESNGNLNGGCGLWMRHGSEGLIADCFFENNRNGRPDGGAINGDSSDLTISRCTFINNRSSRLGGAIFLSMCDLEIDHCRFENNFSGADPGHGGALVCSAGRLDMDHCEFINNTARGGSAGAVYLISVRGGSVSNCVFSGNQAGQIGGAVQLWNLSNVDFLNCLFIDNQSGQDGGALGITNNNAYAEIFNCSFVDNDAAGMGGGIYVGNTASIAVQNSIFWENNADAGDQIFVQTDQALLIMYSCVQDGVNPDDDWEFEDIFERNNIDGNPLFVNGPEIDFGLNGYFLDEDSPCIDVGTGDADRNNLQHTTTSPELTPDRGLIDLGYHYLLTDFGIAPPRELAVALREGWNMISLNVTPSEEFWEREEGPDIILMTDQLREGNDHHLVLMKDGLGRFYAPEFEFNNIPYWDLAAGYLICVDEELETVWSGDPIDPQTAIPLLAGWNMVAYYPTYELDVSAPDFYGFSSIVEDLLMAKDQDGNFLNTEFNFSNLPPLQQSQGYLIDLAAACELVYAVEQEQVAGRINPNQHTVSKSAPSSENMSVLVTGLVGGNNLTGAELVARDEAGVIVGRGLIDETGRWGLAVWGDDPGTTGKEGLTSGESFYLELNTGGAAQRVSVSQFLSGEALEYETNGFLVVQGALEGNVPQEFYLSEVYPNPFNNRAVIQFGLPEQGLINVQIYDLTGRLVETLAKSNLPAGHHRLIWNADGVANGMYLVRMQNDRFSGVRKVMLVK